jgi:WD40 repeat protein
MWEFIENPSSFTFVTESKFHNRCVQNAKLVNYYGTSYLITADTAGRVCLWDLSSWSLDKPIQIWKAHQSGIKALDVHIGLNSLKIASGGDDGAVTVIEIDQSFLTESKVSTLELAHSSSVTGTAFESADTLFSVSIDQRIKKWKLSDGITLLDTTVCDVADVGDMSICDDSIFVVGHGMQAFEKPSTLLVAFGTF